MDYIEHYNNYKDKIFGYFYYNLSKDRELAEDLTSEVFLKGFKKIDSYDDTYEFSTWIFTIARNTLFDFYKKNKQEVSLDEQSEISFTEFVKYEEDFSQKLDTSEDMKQVYKSMEKLPIARKEMIVMKYLGELSTKEISKMTGRKEPSVRKILSRGLKKLETLLYCNSGLSGKNLN